MGFNDRSTSGVFCRIANGKVVRNAEAGTPGAIRVEKKDKKGNGTGEFTFQLHSDSVDGRITRLQAKVDQFNGEEIRKLTVTLNDGGQLINVDINEKSRYWQYFMYALPNIDMTKPVELMPWDFTPAGEKKPKTGMTVKQGGSKVPPAFTRESPGKLPPPTEAEFDGKIRLDFFKQRQWLLENVLPEATDRINEALGSSPAPEVVQRQTLPPEDMQAQYGGGGKDAPKPTPIGEDDEPSDLPW
jgi:hypothetical protein